MRLELQRVYGQQLKLICGTPQQVNRSLITHEVAVAPASSICLLNNLQLNMALPLGVACDGQVQSVYLGFGTEQQELLANITARNAELAKLFRDALPAYGNDLRGLARYIRTHSAPTTMLSIPIPLFKLSPHSATSNVLLHVLYRLWFGEENYRYFTEHIRYGKDAQVQLLIGDEALNATQRFQYILDLGKMWKDITGLPFVFAVWQSYTPLPELWCQRLLQAAELATARMRIEPSDYLAQVPSNCNVDLAHYWQHIHYTLKQRELKSLYLFLNLYRLFNAHHEANEALSTRLVRWEEQASYAY